MERNNFNDKTKTHNYDIEPEDKILLPKDVQTNELELDEKEEVRYTNSVDNTITCLFSIPTGIGGPNRRPSTMYHENYEDLERFQQEMRICSNHKKVDLEGEYQQPEFTLFSGYESNRQLHTCQSSPNKSKIETSKNSPKKQKSLTSIRSTDVKTKISSKQSVETRMRIKFGISNSTAKSEPEIRSRRNSASGTTDAARLIFKRGLVSSAVKSLPNSPAKQKLKVGVPKVDVIVKLDKANPPKLQKSKSVTEKPKENTKSGAKCKSAENLKRRRKTKSILRNHEPEGPDEAESEPAKKKGRSNLGLGYHKSPSNSTKELMDMIDLLTREESVKRAIDENSKPKTSKSEETLVTSSINSTEDFFIELDSLQAHSAAFKNIDIVESLPDADPECITIDKCQISYLDYGGDKDFFETLELLPEASQLVGECESNFEVANNEFVQSVMAKSMDKEDIDGNVTGNKTEKFELLNNSGKSKSSPEFKSFDEQEHEQEQDPIPKLFEIGNQAGGNNLVDQIRSAVPQTPLVCSDQELYLRRDVLSRMLELPEQFNSKEVLTLMKAMPNSLNSTSQQDLESNVNDLQFHGVPVTPIYSEMSHHVFSTFKEVRAIRSIIEKEFDDLKHDFNADPEIVSTNKYKMVNTKGNLNVNSLDFEDFPEENDVDPADTQGNTIGFTASRFEFIREIENELKEVDSCARWITNNLLDNLENFELDEAEFGGRQFSPSNSCPIKDESFRVRQFPAAYSPNPVESLQYEESHAEPTTGSERSRSGNLTNIELKAELLRQCQKAPKQTNLAVAKKSLVPLPLTQILDVDPSEFQPELDSPGIPSEKSGRRENENENNENIVNLNLEIDGSIANAKQQHQARFPSFINLCDQFDFEHENISKAIFIDEAISKSWISEDLNDEQKAKPESPLYVQVADFVPNLPDFKLSLEEEVGKTDSENEISNRESTPSKSQVLSEIVETLDDLEQNLLCVTASKSKSCTSLASQSCTNLASQSCISLASQSCTSTILASQSHNKKFNNHFVLSAGTAEPGFLEFNVNMNYHDNDTDPDEEEEETLNFELDLNKNDNFSEPKNNQKKSNDEISSAPSIEVDDDDETQIEEFESDGPKCYNYNASFENEESEDFNSDEIEIDEEPKPATHYMPIIPSKSEVCRHIRAWFDDTIEQYFPKIKEDEKKTNLEEKCPECDILLKAIGDGDEVFGKTELTQEEFSSEISVAKSYLDNKDLNYKNSETWCKTKIGSRKLLEERKKYGHTNALYTPIAVKAETGYSEFKPDFRRTHRRTPRLILKPPVKPKARYRIRRVHDQAPEPKVPTANVEIQTNDGTEFTFPTIVKSPNFSRLARFRKWIGRIFSPCISLFQKNTT